MCHWLSVGSGWGGGGRKSRDCQLLSRLVGSFSFHFSSPTPQQPRLLVLSMLLEIGSGSASGYLVSCPRVSLWWIVAEESSEVASCKEGFLVGFGRDDKCWLDCDSIALVSYLWFVVCWGCLCITLHIDRASVTIILLLSWKAWGLLSSTKGDRWVWGDTAAVVIVMVTDIECGFSGDNDDGNKTHKRWWN